MSSKSLRIEQIEGLADYCSKALLQALDEATRCCLNCENFETDRETCRLNNLMPPPSIAARGCECFQDKVPF